MIDPLVAIQWSSILGRDRSPTNHDLVWVIIGRLTKTAHFIPILITYSMDRLAKVVRIACSTTPWNAKIDYIRPRYIIYVEILRKPLSRYGT